MYDTEYLTYIRQVLEKAHEFGIDVYVDPHQDVWSRWTGGDGAPLWTLELAGFDTENFRQCEAAVCKETYGSGHSSAEKKGTRILPKMMWPTNYFKLACATMFTLFWAGKRYAPDFMIEDDDTNNNGKDGENVKVNIQTFLQKHYINAIAELLKYLNGLENIVGIGTMNEPSAGYVNVADLSRGFGQSGSSTSSGAMELKYGLAPTPFQGMCLGEGHVQSVGQWSNGIMQHVLGRSDSSVKIDPKGKKVWKYKEEMKGRGSNSNCRGCIWKQAGVWRVNPQTNRPELLRPGYFANVDFGTECYLPFATEYTNVMHAVWKSETPLLVFAELPPLEFSSTPFPKISSSSTTNNGGIPNAVNATHWYDGMTLFTQSWKSYFTFDTRTHSPVFGYNNVLKTHVSQLADIKRLGVDRMENAPTLIGECGIPYDMNNGKSYKNKTSKLENPVNTSEVFSQQLAAMDHTLRCLERNMLSFTLWCYAPDNTNKDGDQWNGEDLSIYCTDQSIGLDKKDPYFIYDGLRAARAFVRPYAQRIAGTPIENRFNMQKGVFIYRGINGDEKKYDVPTEIFVPKLWCLKESDMRISVSSGRVEIEEHDNWFIVKYWDSSPGVEQWVEIRGAGTKKQQSRTVGGFNFFR